MTEHPHQLFAIEFTEADQARLVGFSCGDDLWSRHVTEWIVGSDVLDSMKKWGTRVWLFETSDETIVGFGSVGTTRWRWPLPDGPRTMIALIPMLGIDTRFQGEPAEPEWKYSRQIMAHLIAEAQQVSSDWSGKPHEKPEWLVLQAHRDNQRAIRFYEKCGFELIPKVERDHGHLVMKMWIAE